MKYLILLIPVVIVAAILGIIVFGGGFGSSSVDATYKITVYTDFTQSDFFQDVKVYVDGEPQMEVSPDPMGNHFLRGEWEDGERFSVTVKVNDRPDLQFRPQPVTVDAVYFEKNKERVLKFVPDLPLVEVRVKVLDERGDPRGGVRVEAEGIKTDVTADNGLFFFSVPEGENAVISITAPDGYVIRDGGKERSRITRTTNQDLTVRLSAAGGRSGGGSTASGGNTTAPPRQTTTPPRAPEPTLQRVEFASPMAGRLFIDSESPRVSAGSVTISLETGRRFKARFVPSDDCYLPQELNLTAGASMRRVSFDKIPPNPDCGGDPEPVASGGGSGAGAAVGGAVAGGVAAGGSGGDSGGSDARDKPEDPPAETVTETITQEAPRVPDPPAEDPMCVETEFGSDYAGAIDFVRKCPGSAFRAKVTPPTANTEYAIYVDVLQARYQAYKRQGQYRLAAQELDEAYTYGRREDFKILKADCLFLAEDFVATVRTLEDVKLKGGVTYDPEVLELGRRRKVQALLGYYDSVSENNRPSVNIMICDAIEEYLGAFSSSSHASEMKQLQGRHGCQ